MNSDLCSTVTFSLAPGALMPAEGHTGGVTMSGSQHSTYGGMVSQLPQESSPGAKIKWDSPGIKSCFRTAGAPSPHCTYKAAIKSLTFPGSLLGPLASQMLLPEALLLSCLASPPLSDLVVMDRKAEGVMWLIFKSVLLCNSIY